jgi:hypothetical protein
MDVSRRDYAPAALPPGKKTWYQLNRRLVGSHGRAESFEEDRNLLSLSEFEPRKGPVRSLSLN